MPGYRIRFNSPTVLTFSLIAVAVYFINRIVPNFTLGLFASPPRISWGDPLDYFRLVSHVAGHASWGHLLGNLAYILLLGPLLEEKYGAGTLALMMVVTAVVTGLVNAALFSTGLLGASGIVFMFIILASMADARKGTVPLTFILVALIFIGTELVNALRSDNISQSAHLIGGGLGAAFGSSWTQHRRRS
ncbi:MAG: rhomboid family intramembrane serine protease [Candidatus Eisenbacteria bacterium]|nr:rhomboid family intramembrane serine protease [Candidatus Eisenbacteria bacterium]